MYCGSQFHSTIPEGVMLPHNVMVVTLSFHKSRLIMCAPGVFQCLVRKKSLFWQHWFQTQERVSSTCSQLAVRNIHEQFRPSRHPVPVALSLSRCVRIHRSLLQLHLTLRRMISTTTSRFDCPFSELRKNRPISLLCGLM